MDLSVSSATLLPAKVSSMTLLLRCRPSRIALPPLAPRLFHRRSMRLSEVFFASISPRAPAPVEEMPLLRRSSSVSDELRARACRATGCDPTRGPGRMLPTPQAARARAGMDAVALVLASRLHLAEALHTRLHHADGVPLQAQALQVHVVFHQLRERYCQNQAHGKASGAVQDRDITRERRRRGQAAPAPSARRLHPRMSSDRTV